MGIIGSLFVVPYDNISQRYIISHTIEPHHSRSYPRHKADLSCVAAVTEALDWLYSNGRPRPRPRYQHARALTRARAGERPWMLRSCRRRTTQKSITSKRFSPLQMDSTSRKRTKGAKMAQSRFCCAGTISRTRT